MSALKRAEFDRLLQAAGCFESLGPFSGDYWERLPYLDILDRAIGEWTASRTRSEVAAACLEAGVPCCPFNSVGDIERDPQFAFRGFLREIDDPEGGRFLVPAPPFQIDGRRPGEER